MSVCFAVEIDFIYFGRCTYLSSAATKHCLATGMSCNEKQALELKLNYFDVHDCKSSRNLINGLCSATPPANDL